MYGRSGFDMLSIVAMGFAAMLRLTFFARRSSRPGQDAPDQPFHVFVREGLAGALAGGLIFGAQHLRAGTSQWVTLLAVFVYLLIVVPGGWWVIYRGA
jgi:hypothetical protein